MKTVSVLGATGSIGESTLAIIRKHPSRFRVHSLSAHKNTEKTIALAKEFEPTVVTVTDPDSYQQVKAALSSSNTEVLFGAEALEHIVTESAVDLVVAGIVGNAGMSSVLAAVKAGKTLLLANKESIVAAGELVMAEAASTAAKIIPLDSEHNAIYQCLGGNYEVGERPAHVRNITLTASGGPFWQTPSESFIHITPAEAVAHPKWNMGAKISVDSATLMNKGLEVIEAHWLFNMPNEDINVMVHPQSIIHSLVHFIDGSVLAQLGMPDMQIPISYGLGLGERISNGADFLDLLAAGELNFVEPDTNKFRCLALARDAIKIGGTAPAVLNAANEVTVAAFLQHKIRFDQIATFNDKMLNQVSIQTVESMQQLIDLDQEVRNLTTEMIEKQQQ
ncbi:MAG: 1-deoxy-D-xylulose-5-phosphate reductoisomerase [Marinicella sp.]